MNRLIQTTLKKTVAPSASSKRFFSSSAKALFPVSYWIKKILIITILLFINATPKFSLSMINNIQIFEG
jgi:hypothetical protein